MKYLGVKLYVAGPFFNKDQRAHYEDTVRIVEQYCSAFSVVRDGFICPPTAGHDQQEKAFAINASKIEECDGMVAILDYLGVNLYFDKIVGLSSEMREVIKTPIALPDSGTVWEMGAAYMSGKPVIGYLTGQQNLNLMLARGTVSVARNTADLQAVLTKIIPAMKDEVRLPEVITELRSAMWAGEIV